MRLPIVVLLFFTLSANDVAAQTQAQKELGLNPMGVDFLKASRTTKAQFLVAYLKRRHPNASIDSLVPKAGLMHDCLMAALDVMPEVRDAPLLKLTEICEKID